MKRDRYKNSVEERYKQQARQAKHRGIEWQFTFESWMQLWNESGKFHLRGKGTGKYVMARRGDLGPYSPDNCFICPFEQNVRDGHISCGNVARPKPKKERAARGWTYLKNRANTRPYQVVLGDKYIGCYATQAEAEAAFKEAREAKKVHAFSFVPASLSTPLNEVAEA